MVADAMKVLVIGGGGREHALVWKLKQSRTVSKIWCAPGNGGIARDAECVVANPGDVAGLAALAGRLGADLTLVGPEQPLVLGIADEFARRGLRLVGPPKEAAELEGSKIFAKRFLDRHGIPTAAAYGIYDSPGDAHRGLSRVRWPAVLKADGLCGGKGVLVAASEQEADAFIDRVMVRREFGSGGMRLLLEEALSGQELSFIVLSDGRNFVPLVPMRDHKRAFDEDRGPNTGGMGAYSTGDMISPELNRGIVDTIVRPTLDGLAAEGREYRGFLYFGLMLTSSGPKVLEFNCRLGDPETQAIVMRMDFDLAEVLLASTEGRLDRVDARWTPGASICVVMASGGYPGRYEVGKQIDGLEEAATTPDVVVFHAGTKQEGHSYYTCAGRVLGVSAAAPTLHGARGAVYEAVRRIRFQGAQYRTDIALAAAKPTHGAGD
jgi:phosphoribosylamine---glycine ligase